MVINKKGYLQTLEAVVALLIIYLAVSSILVGIKPRVNAAAPDYIKLTQDSLMKEIQESNILRSCVLNKNVDCINLMVNQSIGDRYGYNVTLCSKDFCLDPSTPLDKSVYARSIVIASNITDYDTMAVNLYLWNKI